MADGVGDQDGKIMANDDDPVSAARRLPITNGSPSQSFFQAVNQRFGDFARPQTGLMTGNRITRDLLDRGRIFPETHLMSPAAYPREMFSPNWFPQLTNPLNYPQRTPSSFFPGVKFFGGATYRPAFADNDRGSLLQDIEGSFYGGGHAPPTPTPTPTTSPRFMLGMNNPNWAQMYGWGA